MCNSDSKNWHEIYLNMAEELASKSRCAAKGVGCLIVKDQNIIASGVNGTPSGFSNCNTLYHKGEDGNWYSIYGDENHRCCDKGFENFKLDDIDSHKRFSMNFEIHAEMNALMKIAKGSGSAEGSILYCNYCPCIQCAKNIIPSGIKTVIYRNSFDDDELVAEFFKASNIQLIKM